MPLILLGDFNFPGINWQSDPPTTQASSSEYFEFVSLCLDFNLHQLVLKPTRCSAQSPNILDLILTTSPEFVSPMTYLPGITDHFIIQCDLNLTLPSLTSSEVIHDYRCADFDAINNNELELFIADYIPSFHFRTVEENWSLFREKATSLITQYIPQKRIYSDSRAPWFNSHLKRLLNKKKRLFRSAKHSGSVERWNAYKIALRSYKIAVAESKKTFYEQTLPSLLKDSTQKLWSVVNDKKSRAIELCDSNNEPVGRTVCCEEFFDFLMCGV